MSKPIKPTRGHQLLNFRQVSILLTGNPDTIRHNRLSKEHQQTLKGLLEYLDMWLKQHKPK